MIEFKNIGNSKQKNTKSTKISIHRQIWIAIFIIFVFTSLTLLLTIYCDWRRKRWLTSWCCWLCQLNFKASNMIRSNVILKINLFSVTSPIVDQAYINESDENEQQRSYYSFQRIDIQCWWSFCWEYDVLNTKVSLDLI